MLPTDMRNRVGLRKLLQPSRLNSVVLSVPLAGCSLQTLDSFISASQFHLQIFNQFLIFSKLLFQTCKQIIRAGVDFGVLIVLVQG